MARPPPVSLAKQGATKTDKRRNIIRNDGENALEAGDRPIKPAGICESGTKTEVKGGVLGFAPHTRFENLDRLFGTALGAKQSAEVS